MSRPPVRETGHSKRSLARVGKTLQPFEPSDRTVSVSRVIGVCCSNVSLCYHPLGLTNARLVIVSAGVLIDSFWNTNPCTQLFAEVKVDGQ